METNGQNNVLPTGDIDIGENHLSAQVKALLSRDRRLQLELLQNKEDERAARRGVLPRTVIQHSIITIDNVNKVWHTFGPPTPSNTAPLALLTANSQKTSEFSRKIVCSISKSFHPITENNNSLNTSLIVAILAVFFIVKGIKGK